MGVLLPNYPRDMVVKGENMPHFQKMSVDKMRAPTGTSNVFQIFNQLQKQQQAVDWSENPVQSISSRTTTPSKSASILTTGTQENNSSKQVQEFPVHNTSWSTSSTQCTCPQAAAAGSEAWRLSSITRVSSYRTAQKYRIIGHFFPKYRTNIGHFSTKYRTK